MKKKIRVAAVTKGYGEIHKRTSSLIVIIPCPEYMKRKTRMAKKGFALLATNQTNNFPTTQAAA